MTRDDGVAVPWPENDGVTSVSDLAPPPRGGTAYADLHAAQRELQDRLAGAALPPDLTQDITERLARINAILAGHQVAEADRLDGWRPDLPGRGHALLPPYVIDGESGSSLWGRVTFTRFYLGGNGAAHGGSQPLLFDDLLGRVVNFGQPGVARTALLKVNYRRITPIGVELRVEASLDSVDGRKRWGTARLFDASDALLSDAEGLFLQLLPGQA
jgi:hypothetical protein